MRDLSSFTNHLIAAHRQKATFDAKAPVPETAEEAYAVQSALMASIGPVGGFKVSRKSGAVATMAPIPSSRCFKSGDRVGTTARVGVELEVGFVVSGRLPAPDDPAFQDKLVAAVRPAPMIELVASRLSGEPAEKPMPKLADLQASEGLIAGEPLASWDGSDFGALDISMASDEGDISTGPAQVPNGSALAALETLVRMAGSHCGGLQVGQRLLTGSVHPLTFIRTNQAVKGRIAGLGEVTVQLC